MRLFVGVPLMGDAAREVLRVMEEARPIAGDCRWVPAANLHCTVRFLGEVSPAGYPMIEDWFKSGLQGLKPGALTLDRAGFFSRREQSVLWIGLQPSAWLEQAAKCLSGRVGKLVPENRPFVPHVTVARCRPGRGGEEHGILERFAGLEVSSVIQKSSRVVLYESVPEPAGPVYVERCVWEG